MFVAKGLKTQGSLYTKAPKKAKQKRSDVVFFFLHDLEVHFVNFLGSELTFHHMGLALLM